MSPKKSQHDTRNEPSHVASTHALKGVNSIVTASSPNRKDLTTLHGRSYCALLAGEDIFSRQQMLLHTLRQTIWCIILKDIYNHISSRNISCPQGISVAVMRTAPLSSRVTSSRCLAAMRATCKESGHAKKHAETCKHRLHKVSFYDCTAKTSSLFDLCASSNSKHAGTVSSSANLYKA